MRERGSSIILLHPPRKRGGGGGGGEGILGFCMKSVRKPGGGGCP